MSWKLQDLAAAGDKEYRLDELFSERFLTDMCGILIF